MTGGPRAAGLLAAGPFAAGPFAAGPFAFLLVAIALAGCTEAAPLEVAWEVRNEGDAAIAYTILLEGGRVEHTENGTLAPGGVDRHTMIVNGLDLMATAMLRNDPRESAGVPFSVDGLCTDHLVTATWDGLGWAVDAAARECQ